MYTTHSEGEDQLFVCSVCEAILVSEKGIEEHVKSQHIQELLRDVEDIRKQAEATRRGPEAADQEESVTSEANSGFGGGEEGLGTAKIDRTYVDRQFYVCRHCDDIFLDKKHLDVHINISHDLKEKEDDSTEASAFATPPQSPKPKRFKKRKLEDESREISRIGLSQTQTPVKEMAPPSEKNTPMTPSSVKKAICLADDSQLDKGINIRLSKDNTAKETNFDSLGRAKDKVFEKKNKANIQKAETVTELSKRSTRSSQRKTPRFSMEVEVTETEEVEVGSQSSPPEEPAIDEKVEDAVTNDESIKDKPRRSKESSTQQTQVTPSFGVGKFYGSTLPSTSSGSKKRPKTPPITVRNNISDKISKSLPKKRKIKSPHKAISTLPASDKELGSADVKSLKVNSNVEYQCPTCGDCKERKETFKHHLLTHYSHVFASVCSAPYKCPECDALSRDKITLMRHYAFTHKKFFTMTDITEDKLKEIMAKALVPKE